MADSKKLGPPCILYASNFNKDEPYDTSCLWRKQNAVAKHFKLHDIIREGCFVMFKTTMERHRFWNLFQPMEQTPPSLHQCQHEPTPETVPASQIETLVITDRMRWRNRLTNMYYAAFDGLTIMGKVGRENCCMILHFDRVYECRL